MVNPAWPHRESPFHEGELALQAKAGVRSQIDSLGRRMLHPYLIGQHRQFLAQLPYAIVGSVDNTGAPWASILTAEAGFLSTPDRQTLRVTTRPLLGDPLLRTLRVGSLPLQWPVPAFSPFLERTGPSW